MTKKKEIHCSTCNVKITNLQGSARFTCPSCGKVEIVRCRRCRSKELRVKAKEGRGV